MRYISLKNSIYKMGVVLNKIVLVILFFLILQLSSAQLKTTVDQVVYDMVGAPFRSQGGFGAPWGANEGFPHGLPTFWDWYHGARPNQWMNKGNNKALSSWGHIFEWKEGSPVKNVRFQIRNHKMYVFSNKKWILAEDVSADIEAGLFRESDYGWTGLIDYRDEKKNEGGVSYLIKPNYCLHWFKKVWEDKKRYDLPLGFEAIYICFEVRIIPDKGKVPNINDAKYLVAVGADYYPESDSKGTENNPSLVISRHKFVTTNWQKVTAYISGSLPNDASEYKNEILRRPLPPYIISNTDE